MSFLEKLKSAIGLSNGINDESKAKIDAAFSQHASDVSDANQKLWDVISAELGLFRDSAGAVQSAAEGFEQYAETTNSEIYRVRSEMLAATDKMDAPPDAPEGFGETIVTP